MSDVFRLAGEYSAVPSVFELGVPQAPEVLAPFLARLYLDAKLVSRVSLTGDAPVSVAFGSLAAANVVVLQANGKVRARLTSSDGSLQALPVDPLLILITSAVSITAIDLTRLPGVNSEVSVFLGERV